MPLGMEVGLSPCDCVRWGPSPLPQKERSGAQPNFWSTSIVAKRLHGSRCHLVQNGGRPQLTQHCVRCGPSYPQKKRAHPPYPILVHVCCGQMAGWMKMPLDTEVDLSPGHIVLYGVPAPAKGAQLPPSFRPMSIVATVAHLSYC